MVRFRFVGLFIALITGCTYFTDVSRYETCEHCDGGHGDGEDLDRPDAAADADAGADADDHDTSSCANGRDC